MEKYRFIIGSERRNIPLIEYINGEAKRVIVALHGFGGDKDSSAIRRLAEAAENTVTVAFDFPAHGDSTAADSELLVENCIADFISVNSFAREKYPDADMCYFATSFGGYILLLSEAHIASDAKVVLRAPAVRMDETFLSVICNCTEAELSCAGGAVCGFERKINVSYDYYVGLKNNCAMDKAVGREMLVIYGDRDDVVDASHIAEFIELHPKARLLLVENADHRFKGKGQLEKIVCDAVRYFSGVHN